MHLLNLIFLLAYGTQVVVEGGAAVICPSHIRLGDVIWVNIEEASYLGKAS